MNDLLSKLGGMGLIDMLNGGGGMGLMQMMNGGGVRKPLKEDDEEEDGVLDPRNILKTQYRTTFNPMLVKGLLD
jgi:hypothetical protein